MKSGLSVKSERTHVPQILADVDVRLLAVVATIRAT